jgi:hypothetical protein
MLSGYYWFRSKVYDEEEVIENSMNRAGEVWRGTDGELWVNLAGFKAEPLKKILKRYHLLEEIKPCSI